MFQTIWERGFEGRGAQRRILAIEGKPYLLLINLPFERHAAEYESEARAQAMET
jgi:hypothetical protein